MRTCREMTCGKELKQYRGDYVTVMAQSLYERESVDVDDSTKISEDRGASADGAVLLRVGQATLALALGCARHHGMLVNSGKTGGAPESIASSSF